jgi:hypothetical protein
MKITKTQLKQIIKEELDDSPWGKWEDEEYPNAPWDEEPPMDGASRGRYDDLFEVGQPGNILAEAVAKSLWLDDESDFEAVVRALKDGLERWKEYR